MTQSKNPPPKKRRLGKGLSAIVGTQAPVEVKQNPNKQVDSSDPSVPEPASEPAPGGVVTVPLDRITANRHQPRERFDDGALSGLAESIKAVGVIQPVVVRPAADGGYELIAGERRVRASRLAGLTEIPAVVREIDDRLSAESALIENLQREDLNPIERSDAIRGLIERFGLSQSDVAERVGLDRSSVSNLLRLGELEPEIQALLIEGLLGMGHGRALLASAPGKKRLGLAERAVRDGWSVRRLETVIRESSGSDLRTKGNAQAARAPSPETVDLERRLGDYLGTKVQVRADPKGRGQISIRFFDLDHFDDLMARIGYTADADV